MKLLVSSAIGLLVLGGASGARAQTEITLIAPGGIRAAVERLIPDFERKTGYKVKATFGSGNGTKAQVTRGEAFDVPIVQPPYPEVLASGNVVAASATPLASISVGIAVKQGARKPDISTPDAVKRALLAAKSISYPNPAGGAAAGVSFEATLKQLGIAEQLEPKIKRSQGGAAAMKMVAGGEAEIGLTFLSEMDEPGLEIVGPLPKEIAPPTSLVAFISAHAKDPAAAKALVQYLASPEASAAYKAQHMEPASPVLGAGNFSHIVENLERSVVFYRDVIGLESTGNARPFDPNPAIMKMGNTIGAQSRIAVLKVPGFDMGLELIEYKDIDRKPAHPRFQDPGAANLVVRFKDLDSVVARLKKAEAHILTAGAVPAAIGGRSRYLFAQDPDGFVLELSQPDPLPANAAQSSGNVIGGGIEVAVEDAAKTAAFYRDVLAFQPSEPGAYNGDKLMTNTAGTPGAQFRESRAPIPGISVNLNWIEFKSIDRKPLRTRVQDPGTALIQLRVHDLDALLKKIKAGGGAIVSVDEQPVQIGNFGRIAIARDPNNLFLELIERP